MDKATLALCILINQRERNKAIGIDNDPQFLRGMTAYIRSASKIEAQGAISQMVKAAYLKAQIEEYQALAERLTNYIVENIGDSDIRNEGVYVMKHIEAYVNDLGKQWETLWRPPS